MGNLLLTTTPPTNPPPWRQEVENQKPWVSQGTMSSGKVRNAFLPSVKTLVLVWKSSFDHVNEWYYKEILCKWLVRLRDLTLPFNTTSHFSWDKPKKVFPFVYTIKENLRRTYSQEWEQRKEQLHQAAPLQRPGLLLELGKTGMRLERAVLCASCGVFFVVFYIFIIYLVWTYVSW